jgi:hypothetical protein
MATHPRTNLRARRRRQRSQQRHDSDLYKWMLFVSRINELDKAIHRAKEAMSTWRGSMISWHGRFSALLDESRALRYRADVLYGARTVRPEYPFDIGKLVD